MHFSLGLILCNKYRRPCKYVSRLAAARRHAFRHPERKTRGAAPRAHVRGCVTERRCAPSGLKLTYASKAKPEKEEAAAEYFHPRSRVKNNRSRIADGGNERSRGVLNRGHPMADNRVARIKRRRRRRSERRLNYTNASRAHATVSRYSRRWGIGEFNLKKVKKRRKRERRAVAALIGMPSILRPKQTLRSLARTN